MDQINLLYSMQKYLAVANTVQIFHSSLYVIFSLTWNSPLPICYFQIVQCCFEISSYLTENTVCSTCYFQACNCLFSVRQCLTQHSLSPSLVSHIAQSVSIIRTITQMHIRVSSSKKICHFCSARKKKFNISTNLLAEGKTKFHENQCSESRVALRSWTECGA